MNDETIVGLAADIDQFAADIRSIVANADLSDDLGQADMIRDVRIRLENIEGRTADIREALGYER